MDPAIDWPSLDAFMEECLALKANAESFANKGLGDGGAYGLSKACANSYTMLLA